MNVQEIPLAFDCEGSQLIGMVHLPETILSRGLITVVAGGPQYRGGVCRLQVQMARALAAAGVPVMRFDYRGLGDSEGSFRGFTDIEADLRAALNAFRQQAPALREWVLWGGCDAASAVMINAWKFPEVTGIALGNPWVQTAEIGDVVAVKHYSRRLHDLDFWLKVLRLQYNPLPALATLARRVFSRLKQRSGIGQVPPSQPAADDPSAPALARMRHGLASFKGDLLLLMSGRSLISKEFDELVAAHADWQQALRSPRHLARYELLDADQALSTIDARQEAIRTTLRWMLSPYADLAPIENPP